MTTSRAGVLAQAHGEDRHAEIGGDRDTGEPRLEVAV